MDRNEAWAALHNPETAADQLQLIAQQHPEFGPQVVAHPNAYPELITWINSWNAQQSVVEAESQQSRRGLKLALIGGGAAVALVLVVGLVLALLGGSTSGGSAQFQVDKLREKPEFVNFMRLDLGNESPYLLASGVAVVDIGAGSSNRLNVTYYRWEDEGEATWNTTIRGIDQWAATAAETGDLLIFGDYYNAKLVAVSISDGEEVAEFDSSKEIQIGQYLTTQLLADGVISGGQVVVFDSSEVALYDATRGFERLWRIREPQDRLTYVDGHLVSRDGEIYSAKTGEEVGEISSLARGASIDRILGVRGDSVIYCAPYGDEVVRYNFKSEEEVVTDVGRDGLDCRSSNRHVLLPNSDTIYLADGDEIFVYDTVKGEAIGDEIDLRSDIFAITVDGDLIAIDTSDGLHWGRVDTPLDKFQFNDDEPWYLIGHSADGVIFLASTHSNSAAFDIESGEELWTISETEFLVQHGRLFRNDYTRIRIQK